LGWKPQINSNDWPVGKVETIFTNEFHSSLAENTEVGHVCRHRPHWRHASNERMIVDWNFKASTGQASIQRVQAAPLNLKHFSA
jgi:hypothetical protein